MNKYTEKDIEFGKTQFAWDQIILTVMSKSEDPGTRYPFTCVDKDGDKWGFSLKTILEQMENPTDMVIVNIPQPKYKIGDVVYFIDAADMPIVAPILAACYDDTNPVQPAEWVYAFQNETISREKHLTLLSEVHFNG